MNDEKNNIYAKIGENIRKIRQSQKLTQAELAKMISVSTFTVNSLENSRRMPALDVFFRIADALKVPLAVLFDIEVSRKDDSDIETVVLLLRRLDEREIDWFKKHVEGYLAVKKGVITSK